MKDLSKIMTQLTLVGQLGLSLATPLLLCLFVCYLLISKLSAPAWIYIPGFILGIGSSMMTAWKFYTAVISRDNKKKKDSTISFNDHV